MRQIELSPVEYKALMAFADGGSVSRPVRRRLLQAGALCYARYGSGEPVLKLTESAERSLVENAPRSKWVPPSPTLTEEQLQSRRAALASRTGIAGMVMLSAAMFPTVRR